MKNWVAIRATVVIKPIAFLTLVKSMCKHKVQELSVIRSARDTRSMDCMACLRHWHVEHCSQEPGKHCCTRDGNTSSPNRIRCEVGYTLKTNTTSEACSTVRRKARNMKLDESRFLKDRAESVLPEVKQGLIGPARWPCQPAPAHADQGAKRNQHVRQVGVVLVRVRELVRDHDRLTTST